MFKLFVNGNSQELVKQINDGCYRIENVSFNAGLFTALCSKNKNGGQIELIQGHNFDLVEKIPAGASIEASIITWPCKFIFARTKKKEEGK